MTMNLSYPPIVSTLPEIDVSIPGVRGWLLQGPTRQAVFFRLEPGGAVPEHSHGAQWGVVLEGQIELTISGRLQVVRKGDTYEIPAGAPHAARCAEGALVMDLFHDPARYRPKA